jgi:hypothetical protein
MFDAGFGPSANFRGHGGLPCGIERRNFGPIRRVGAETLGVIKRDLWLADRGLYAEKAESNGDNPTVPAFMWGAGVQLTALAAAAQSDRIAG